MSIIGLMFKSSIGEREKNNEVSQDAQDRRTPVLSQGEPCPNLYSTPASTIRGYLETLLTVNDALRNVSLNRDLNNARYHL